MLHESYTDLDRHNARKYEGEPVWRVISLLQEDGRTQMYTIGLGARDEEKTNFFEPVIRAARYTTEESFLFLSEKSANAFLKAFRQEYGSSTDYNLRNFHASEYHPFNEITTLIPISSPLGDAYVGEQKVQKKSYETDEE